ncbi:hypothetical protein E4T56_gene16140 [Termitomyces sp. T112]|nr:hypothetical protein E4T56_gene16140 [Termitomyces sp. T112]
MSMSSSVSTSQSCVRSVPTYKMCPPTPPEPSYFSIPTYPTLSASTPLVATSLTLVTPSSNNTSGRLGAIEERPFSIDHEVLDHFAAHFPPPPSLTLPTHRQQMPNAFAPRIVTFHHTMSQGASPSSPDRAHRSPSSYFPKMDVSTIQAKHTFRVQLPNTIESEMITISANKGDKLKVVADAWNMQSDCHYEWQICFAPCDVDLSAVQARFEPGGQLTIDVRRTGRHVVSI